jgi:thiamine biosynthesis lipoprotein
VQIGRARWAVWGTTATVLVADDSHLPVARCVVAAELRMIDRACSRHRPDSELSRVNRAGGRPMSTSSAFCDALRAALRAAALTDGAVDPTVGEAMRVWAADDCSYPRVVVSPGGRPDWRAVSFDEASRTVMVAGGLTLDLGATAKALASDRAAAAVHRETGCGVLVNLGGDIALAGDAPDGGWRVRAMEDHRGAPDDPGQTVAITVGGLATSSTTVRRWRRGSRPLHHIIDPATGRPAAGNWRTVSVAAADCVDANAASTAAIVHGDAAVSWLAERGLPARLVARDGTVATTGGWPVEEAACR